MNVCVLIQARSTSTRLKGKIFMDIFGVPMLQRVYDACKKADVGDVMVIGPSGDDELKKWCEEKKIPCTCPDVPCDDLISRYVEASKGYEAVVRITSDCPMMEPIVIQKAVEALKGFDYVSNTMVRTMPDGYDVQACKRTFIEWVDRAQKNHREHPFFEFDNNAAVRDGTGFKIFPLVNPVCVCPKCQMAFPIPSMIKNSVDDEKDLAFVRHLIEQKESKLVKV